MQGSNCATIVLSINLKPLIKSPVSKPVECKFYPKSIVKKSPLLLTLWFIRSTIICLKHSISQMGKRIVLRQLENRMHNWNGSCRAKPTSFSNQKYRRIHTHRRRNQQTCPSSNFTGWHYYWRYSSSCCLQSQWWYGRRRFFEGLAGSRTGYRWWISAC